MHVLQGATPQVAHPPRSFTPVLSSVVLALGAFLSVPLYPAYQAQFGFSDLTLTLLHAAFPLFLLLGLLGGARLGHRSALLLGAAGALCLLLADAPSWLFAGRILQGVALGLAIAALVRWSRASVALTAIVLAGAAAGPVLGGVLAQFPLLAHLGYLIVLLITLVMSLRQAPMEDEALVRPVSLRVPHALRWPFALSATTGFLAWAVAALFLVTIPVVLERSLGIEGTVVTGLLLGLLLAAAAGAQWLAPRLSVLADPRRTQVVGLAGLLFGLLVLGMSQGQSLVAVLAAAVVAGCGLGLGHRGAVAEMGEVLDPQQRKGVRTALYLTFGLGAGLSAVLLGLLAQNLGLGSAIAALSAALAVVTLAALYLSHAVARARDMVVV